MAVFVDAQPKKAHYRSFTVRGLDGQDDFASMGAGDRPPLRAAARCRRRRPVRRELRDRPEPRRDRRRQGAAGCGARGDAGDGRAAAGRRDRAREARGGGVRAGAVAADPARPPRPGAAAAPADPRRGAPVRDHVPPAEARHAGVRVDLRHARRDRPGATPRDPAALRLGRPLPRRVAGGARGGARAAGEDGAVGVRPAPPHRRAWRRPEAATGPAGPLRPWPCGSGPSGT